MWGETRLTLAQNKRNIRWGLYSMFAAISWGIMQVELLSALPSDMYKWFALVSLSILIFLSFFLLVVFGLLPRFARILIRAEILTDEQANALKMLPKLDEKQ